ncbi:MAG: hypothetical protein EOP42_00870 [Sphingobacteriaceae bacterium]|nr:MAG: hypothetical protein EOP42_00870 [Sphingobacteriaceae bacterium]
MSKPLPRILLFFLLILTIVSCRKQAYDDFYGRPDNLAPAIYQQLQARGNFTSLLVCIDKAGYKNTLSNAGYWTMFAPNDDAFKQYLQAINVQDINKLADSTAKKIVNYALIYNAFQTNHIADYQSSAGWVANAAFKRRTAYYDGVYPAVVNGQQLNVLSSNRNGSTYLDGDNNNKYVPYFYSSFMAAKGLTEADYKYLYPNSAYTGFNVDAGAVVNKDIVAENGVIHEVNKVTTPLPSLEQYLAANPNYSVFRQLYEKYQTLYALSLDATHRFQVLTGSSGQVSLKFYSDALSFSPNNENYVRLQDNDGQSDGYSLFVPNNAALNNYLSEVILENYKSVDKLPINIINDLLNAHMWQTTVWPSKFSTTNNAQGEPARFNAGTDVTDKKVCSNGFFYGTNKVQMANVFNSVYSRPYLDPNYSLMTRALDQSLKFLIINPSIKTTLVMMPDNVLRGLGVDYSSALTSFTYTAPGAALVSGNPAVGVVNRLLNLHVILTPNDELKTLTGSGIVETYGGEYIKYQNGRFFAAGNVDFGTSVATPSNLVRNTLNGPVYYQNNNTILSYTSREVGYHISINAAKAADPFFNFYQFLQYSALYTPLVSTAGVFTGGNINGVQSGVFYTVFIPTNAAIQDAVNKGFLPGTGAGAVKMPNFNPSLQADKDLVIRFIQYHILKQTTVVPDGKKTGVFPSLYNNATGDPTTFTINSTPGTMQITDAQGNKANLIPATSNVLSNRVVIHQIDNFLRY